MPIYRIELSIEVDIEAPNATAAEALATDQRNWVSDDIIIGGVIEIAELDEDGCPLD